MQTNFIRWGAVLAALAVVFGAFGAHALKTILTEANLITFETGVRYQFYHAFAILIAGILHKEFPNKHIQRCGWFFGFGILFFSVSLYCLSMLDYLNMSNMKWIGAITPLGGLCFILGWLLMAVGISKKA